MDSKSVYSQLKDLVRVLSSIQGDLANVTGPPAFLAPTSVVEVGQAWAERPAVFAAPGIEPDPARRCLLVLRFFLAALRSQLYVGGCAPDPGPAGSKFLSRSASPAPKNPRAGTSLKKPLNAFLGELHFASWREDSEAVNAAAGVRVDGGGRAAGTGTGGEGKAASPATHGPQGEGTEDGMPAPRTHLVSEQVSHHPPITAIHMSSDPAHGVRADGYARVEMTFNGTVLVRQVGHGVLRLAHFGDEAYVFPLPDVKVRGFLGGCLYPEITGTYRILSDSGFAAEVVFSGEGLLPGRGTRNAFRARVYRRRKDRGCDMAQKWDENEDGGEEGEEGETLYEASGVWSRSWTVRDARTGEVVETFDHGDPRWAAATQEPSSTAAPARGGPAPRTGAGVQDMDPWESRRAWAGVLGAMGAGDMRAVVTEKTRVEQAQRDMRARERAEGRAWEPLLFRAVRGRDHDVFHRVVRRDDAKGTKESGGWALEDDRTKGVWVLDEDRLRGAKRPFRGELTPLG